MISHLCGKVSMIFGNEAVIDVSGVGYKVICSSKTLSKISSANVKDAFLYTELIIRENSWTIYGFEFVEEREWFNLLVSVQGVGGKVAIAILSALTINELRAAFLNENKSYLCRADGVGDKLAARIISELRTKVEKIYGISSNCGIDHDVQLTGNKNDAISALVNLGYAKSDIVSALSNKDFCENESLESIIKYALQQLAGYKK